MSVVWQKRTHGVLRRPALDQETMRLSIGVILALTAVAAAYLALNASNVRLAREIWRLRDERLPEIQRQNSLLQVEIARASSIPVLQARSVELGYVPAASIEYIGEVP